MTVFNFQPSSQAPFQFQPVLDGQSYTAIITWNLFAKRYYFNLYALDGTLILATALVGSAASMGLRTLSWTLGKVSAATEVPHVYRVGSTAELTISGVTPSAYNGRFPCLIQSRTQFEYSLTNNPGGVSQLGAVSYDINLVAGYFVSSLVYRTASRQFEVSP